jgi:hypothetical protein
MTGKVTVTSSDPAKTDMTLNTPGHDNKYGKVLVENKCFHQGEPVFVLRAQDPLAAAAVRVYAELCEAAGCDDAHTTTSLDAAARIDDWQRANPTLVKGRPG